MVPHRLALAFALALWATSAQAEWMDGNQLEDMCVSTSALDRGLCLSYVMGVLDGARFQAQPLKTPDGTSAGQVRDVVVRYLANHLEGKAQPARMIIKVAVVEAWPALQPKPPQTKQKKKR